METRIKRNDVVRNKVGWEIVLGWEKIANIVCVVRVVAEERCPNGLRTSGVFKKEFIGDKGREVQERELEGLEEGEDPAIREDDEERENRGR